MNEASEEPASTLACDEAALNLHPRAESIVTALLNGPSNWQSVEGNKKEVHRPCSNVVLLKLARALA
jgi:hypothetical protein